MPGLNTNRIAARRSKLPALPAVALVCLVLLALLAVVQVAHFHSDTAAADHCPLCISMHSAAPVAVAAMAVVLVRIGAQAPVFQPQSIARYWHPKLYTRPPPAGC